MMIDRAVAMHSDDGTCCIVIESCIRLEVPEETSPNKFKHAAERDIFKILVYKNTLQQAKLWANTQSYKMLYPSSQHETLVARAEEIYHSKTSSAR